ncbi:MAG TPA: 30S ribosomal protein S4 [Bacillota bacterium]|jgi:small subunit ribosomal protein S4|nr:30S ribosomal protein S4 [Fastidiosipila sp.]HPX93273.1 30S ribosomal protein S4 [Bacillota bacterium]HQB80932.1 30S ribosomal protein S4 [Bacillota bacterium]
MAKDRSPILKRSRTLEVPPQMLGINKKSKRSPRQTRRKEGEYSRQLRAKQSVKFVYGVLEKQFRNTYERASKMPGKSGENLLKLLELRLDNVVYRLGFTATRAQARQLINHGHFNINGRRASIPSMQVSPGDEITVRENSRHVKVFDELPNTLVPAWLSFDPDHLKGAVLRLPERDEIDLDVEETLIVELYSK